MQGSRLDQSDKTQNSRRPSTKNNGPGSSQSTGAGSQASINQKDSNKGFSALSGVPKAHYTNISNANAANLRPPIGQQTTQPGNRYPPNAGPNRY